MPTYNAAQKKAYAEQKRAEQREMLAQAVANLCSSEGWQQYLETRAKFYNYSFSNTILIALQCPNASQVCGAAKWSKEFDRQVTKGEKAIKILAPQFVYAKDDAGNIILVDGKKQIERVWYKTVNVFDISQTEGEPVPSIPLQPITGESHEEYLYRAEQFINGLGAKVDHGVEPFHFTDMPLVAHIDASKAVNSQVRELIQACAEIAGTDMFASLVDEDFSTEKKRVIVESAAYLTCQSVGLDTSGMTVPYIASWGNENGDPKAALDTLRDFAGKIDELAKTIEEGIS